MKTNVTQERLGVVSIILFIAEVLLIVLSWLLSAMRLEGVRSLLSSEGVRWFLGSFSEMTGSPPLVWLLLLLSSFGCLHKSGVMYFRHNYRDRIALRTAAFLLLAYVVVIVLLTLAPHAILLSATGELFPSAFSRSIIPLMAFGISLFGLVFGMMAGRLNSAGAILYALSFGISKGSSILVIYILLIQFYESLRFVFG